MANVFEFVYVITEVVFSIKFNCLNLQFPIANSNLNKNLSTVKTVQSYKFSAFLWLELLKLYSKRYYTSLEANQPNQLLTYISGNNISSLAISIFWNKVQKSQDFFLKVPGLSGPFLLFIWDFLKFSNLKMYWWMNWIYFLNMS